ncbi:MAG TPA: M6 family metalloprotease domain-containing protein, partial [Marine Group III euryarchaeote]|nr:M6 family metalloprotease domain-containing protein [Marine Group III euryarchaeote]
QNFVRDSVEIADDDIDYRNYDAVMVIHSGPGEESSGNSDDIWSIHWTTNIETEDNGYEIKRITQAPEYQNSNGERSPLGVWVHEFGHELGLPDLYDTDGSSEGIGHWGVMASGSWANNGETPVYLAAWSRYELEWIEPVVITNDITGLVLEPIENGGITYMLPIPGNWSGSDEYFLIENRQQMKYDQYMPGEGLLIWHIDDSQGGNSDEDHKLVDLEEADGDDDLDHKTNRGDDEDPYNSGSFSKDTYPDSLAYNGTESGWKIENIEVDGSNIIVDISFLSKPHAVADADEAVIAEGFELQFYGDESWDEDGNIVNYTWDFGDGTFSYDENPIHIFTTNGTYDVILTVRDNNNLEDSVILNIFVNKPPIAVVEISQTVILLGDVITFDASDSYDIDGEVEFFYWNFDDGFTSNQATIEHEFRNSGFYNVSVKIIDDLNDITTVYYLIEVINRLPHVDFTIEPEEGDTRTIFSFTDQSYDDDGEVEVWLWDFGDSDNTDFQNPEHRFALPGIYTVTLTVYDDQEGFNSTSKTITVDNSPPDPDIVIPEGIKTGDHQWTVPADRTIIIDGRVSTDTENDDLEFYWTFGEENFQGYLFEIDLQTGIHEIQLNVIDERGGEETETFTLN